MVAFHDPLRPGGSVRTSAVRPGATGPAVIAGHIDLDAELRLITCGGTFDPATGHYLSNTIVYTTEES